MLPPREERAKPEDAISPERESANSSISTNSILNNNNNNNNNHLHHNNMKHPSLKRVSFGSSKGSMVETLIYDHPLPEEDLSYYENDVSRNCGAYRLYLQFHNPHHLHQFHHTRNSRNRKTPKTLWPTQQQPRSNEVSTKPPAKVRVTFYESQKPHYVSSPETPDDLDLPIMASPSPSQDKTGYIRQDSTEGGRDNPFRPDGDLSKEADEIVELIKEGKPIVGTPSRQVRDITDHLENGGEGLTAVPPETIALLQASDTQASPSPANTESPSTPSKAMNNVGGYDKKSGINGTAPATAVTPEAIEVQHGIVVPPSDESQVEHVVIKKKPKCKCCEIM